MTGEITIETVGGTDDLGIIILLIRVTWIDIGEAVIGEVTMDGKILVDMVVVLVDPAVLVIDTKDN